MGRLWISAAVSPYGNEYGLIAVVAETRDEAIAKARDELESSRQNLGYVPHQEYAKNLLDNIENMRDIPEGVLIDWDSVGKRR